jgi:anti-sigma factor (TIGR02949 family)
MKPIACSEATQQFFAYLDRVLSGESLEALEAHLEKCLSCCDQLEFTRKLDAFVKERVRHTSMPLGMEERLKSALRRAATDKK